MHQPRSFRHWANATPCRGWKPRQALAWSRGADWPAELYWTKADYARVEPLRQRAVAILEKVLGPEHPDVATAIIRLAALYDATGDYAKAESLCRRALATQDCA